MSKSEIQSWINNTANTESVDLGDENQVWQRDRVLNDWDRSLEYAQTQLLTNKTKVRVQFLREELLSLAKHADLSLSQMLDVFRLLTLTYPRYNDNQSRDAVEEVGMALVKRDETSESKFGVAEQILGWLSNEVGQYVKRGIANTSVLIRLKHVPEEPVSRLPADLKDSIISLYTTHILMSKTALSEHIPDSLNDFISTFVTAEDFTKTILPTLERALLRSPENSLPLATKFFSAYPHPLDNESFKKAVTQAVNSSKSSNAAVRTNSIQLFKAILETNKTASEAALSELLTLPKTGKTAGPDHRIALYTMLGYLPPDTNISSSLIQSASPLLTKETNETATSTLAAALPSHIVFLLRNSSVPTEVSQLIAKELGNSKPAVRRAFATLIGSVFYQHEDLLETDAGVKFAKAVTSALQNSLKTISTNALTAPGGPIEGYIALAVLLGPLSRSGKFGDVIQKDAVVSSLVTSSTKQPFLLWDKVYQKLTDTTEELWLLRAAEAALQYFEPQVLKSDSLRSQFGLIFVHLAVDGHSPEIRKLVNETIVRQNARSPKLTNTVIREALTAFLAKGPPSSEEPGAWTKHARVSSLLSSCATFEEAVSSEEREPYVLSLLVIGHHPLTCAPSRQTWIDLCQKASLDPLDLVVKHLGNLVELIVSGTKADPKSRFDEAAYAATTTLTFIAPSSTIPEAIKQIESDLDASVVGAFTDLDIGVWMTPADTTYVDVLSSKTDQRPTKGKEADIAKWEEEVRKSIASKKSAAASLTKQQQAAVNAQLAKEATIRENIARVKRNLERGLHLIQSIVAAGSEELRFHISNLIQLLLKGPLRGGSFLVGPLAFETYLDLSKVASDRLDVYRKLLGIAVLRCNEVPAVPQDFQSEELNGLVLRVLYRLRFLSEQTPLDAATFSYAFPLLQNVLASGGVQPTDEDEALEQVSLALSIIKFHSGEFHDVALPRLETLKVLVQVVRTQLRLNKEASSAIIELGEAIQVGVTRQEVNVLLKATLSQETHARNAFLQTLQPFDLTDLDRNWSPELWIAYHDEDEQNTRLAERLWEDNGLDVPDDFLDVLLPYLEHENAYVRSSTTVAIAEAVEQVPQTAKQAIGNLRAFYREKAKILAPEFDQYGMVIASSLDRSDPWPARLAVATAFEKLAPLFPEDELEPFFSFLIKEEALGDRVAEVRRGMLSSGVAVIDLHGDKRLAALISVFESHLARPSTTETEDHTKEAVIILFGRVARHLDASDARISKIVDRLAEALKTPSEQVQLAVAECLSPLAPLIRSRLPSLVDQLFQDLFHGEKYAVRRGAAYGLAGVIRGTGISGLKEFNVIRRLETAAEEKKHFQSRQGAMFAFDTMSSTLGRLFEPYVTSVLPHLLSCFGDATADVREATQDTARIIMGNLSGYGVKLILPTLLEGLDEKQWRSKKGSIELLGMMAYCSPRQLSLSLPIIIPRLTDVLTDSHAQVRTAANKSLKQFGEVISNPEIQALVPVLLKALVDPARTQSALSSLLKTSFMHYIDHSSLALVVPIIERGLKERGSETKKKAAQIVGNLASLTDSKDFVPYLDELLPMVHQVLVDPVPEARATAAKSLGTLVERLGEVHFPDLVPGLLRTLKTDTSGVDRQGAAQGLSEVLSGLGMERLEGLLPDILANARSPRATVREGFMSLLVYLPATFGTRFSPHLPKIIPPILSGLSDSEEYVREAAMRAGRMVVNNYATRAIDLLLPELEQGMFDPGWRIRQSSITLVGELLFKVSGISGKSSELDEEDVAEEATAVESSRKALLEVLGAERRDRILAALYLVRQDGVVVVRQASIQIWKALVHNTPRTVREILPEIVSQIVYLVAGDEPEQQEIAGRTVGELCRKFGERILGEIIPLLKTKSTSTDPRIRQGVCLTLSEILQNATETQREDYEDAIIAMVRVSLVDDEAEVRSAAAQAFDILQSELGAKAIDETIPTLLEALRQPGKGSGTALQALQEVMSVRATTVFPVLIPTLTAIPMTVFNARALASLVKVAGNALSRRLTVILGALVKVIESDPEPELAEAADEAVTAILSSISDAEGLHTLMMLLLGWAKHDTPRRRVSAFKLFSTFCEVSELEISLYRIDWIRQLVSSLEDPNVDVHTAAWKSFDAFVKATPKDELEPLVVPLRRTIESTGSPGTTVPGFNLPKGVAPTVPIIIAGLTTGSNEQREQAAYAIGDLVERTEEAAIKPFVVPFTGPLIRVATQATTYPPGVKIAILSALTTMLKCIPAFLKPFFPQLQRTFVKSASDPATSNIRTRAARGLGELMKHQARVDPVVTELVTTIHASEDESVTVSLIVALAFVVFNGKANVGEKARESCIELVSEAFRSVHGEHYSAAIGDLMVALSDNPESLQSIISSYLAPGTNPSSISSYVVLRVMESQMNEDSEFYSPNELNVFQKLGLMKSVAQKILENAANEKPIVARPAREARDFIRELDDSSLKGLF
ncbi:hypothetical protein EST38_g2167 [Candolleomyces aberdarensis]|uniref:TOG domain-containing protein n=1 Tax=Candolleomyces aberdarensis TaxID=2316362 RepID=A0A4Q2DT52_9AGAR|nr:hypothetical protein EST38_g2167 [Candolleomyces aberdarensis]